MYASSRGLLGSLLTIVPAAACGGGDASSTGGEGGAGPTSSSTHGSPTSSSTHSGSPTTSTTSGTGGAGGQCADLTSASRPRTMPSWPRRGLVSSSAWLPTSTTLYFAWSTATSSGISSVARRRRGGDGARRGRRHRGIALASRHHALRPLQREHGLRAPHLGCRCADGPLRRADRHDATSRLCWLPHRLRARADGPLRPGHGWSSKTEIYKVPLDGSGGSLLGQGDDSVIGGGAYPVLVDGSTVYFTSTCTGSGFCENQNISAMPTTGGASSVFAKLGQAIDTFAADADNLYVGAGSTYVVSKATAQSHLLYDGGFTLLDGTDLYFGTVLSTPSGDQLGFAHGTVDGACPVGLPYGEAHPVGGQGDAIQQAILNATCTCTGRPRTPIRSTPPTDRELRGARTRRPSTASTCRQIGALTRRGRSRGGAVAARRARRARRRPSPSASSTRARRRSRARP